MNTEERATLKELYHILVNQNDHKVLPYLHVLGEMVGQNSDFITLRSLLASEAWPEAIEKNLICAQDSEVDKISRAEGILELLVEKDLKEKKFLDFGCGEGHVVYKALVQEPKLSVGYDVKPYETWANFGQSPNMFFTTDFSEVQARAPYDVVLLYDVIDHMTKPDAQEALKQARDLMAKDATLYLRAHPFCSRHATHLYHKTNKAFMHLVFTPNELEEMGYESEPSAHVVYPIKEYEELFRGAGLMISHHNVLREKVDAFFKKTPLVKERIRMHYTDSTDKIIRTGGFPEFQCEQQFLDYVLKRKDD